MVLVSTYLAFKTPRRAVRAAISITRAALAHLLAVLIASGQALSDAQEMRRVMTQKHPFIDL